MSFDQEKTTDQFMDCLKHAIKSAKENKNINLTPFHFAYGIFHTSNSFGQDVLTRFGAQSSFGFEIKPFLDQLLSEIKRLPSQNPPPSSPSPSHMMHEILDNCENLRVLDKSMYIDVGFAIISLYKDNKLAEFLTKHGLDQPTITKIVTDLKRNKPTMNRKAESSFDALNKYGRNLTQLAAEGKLDKVIGRSSECNRLLQVLQRRRKNSAILTGPPGCGKTAIAELLAARIVSNDVPEQFKGNQLYELSLTELIAGASARGDFEERLQSVLEEVNDANGQIILFIDEIHQLLGIGSTGGAMDGANILKPALARGGLKLIGATTTAEYKIIEKDPALERRFAEIVIKEPTVEECISILRGIKPAYELFFGLKISDSALVSAATLANRYITNRFMPDSSIDLLDIACAANRVALDSKPAMIDELERKLLQLQVEAEALRLELEKPAQMGQDDSTTRLNDEDNYLYEQTQQRLTHVRDLIKQTQDELAPLQELYTQQRGTGNELQAAKRKLDSVMTKLEQAQRNKDLNTAADLKFNVVPELKDKIKKLDQKVQEEKQQAMQNAIQKNKSNDGETLVGEVVTADHIAAVVATTTGIPVSKLSQSDRQRILTLDEQLSRQVVGQRSAIKVVSDAIVRSRAGFNSKHAPLGSFLFCGTTGTGKTELAKALARTLFDSDKALLRFDMSEFQEQHSVSRLIGAPPGYIGYDQGGQLTEAVRKSPYQVLLFDEVEKSHKSVWNVFLQILDDGRLTDSKGRTVDFTNTILIFTSNLGSQRLLANINADGHFKKDFAAVKEEMMIDVRSYFRPEMLNRFTDLVVFTPLTRDDINQIVALQVAELGKRLSSQDIRVEITKDAIDHVLMRVYDPLFGARPLKRWIERIIVTQLSKFIIKGDLKHHMLVKIDCDHAALQQFQQSEQTSTKTTTNANGNGKFGGVSFVDKKDPGASLLSFHFIPFNAIGIKENYTSLPKDDAKSSDEEIDLCDMTD